MVISSSWPALRNLSEITLNKTRITDYGLETIAKLRGLRDLRLELTRVENGVAKLNSLEHLEWLSLDGTKVTDDALPNLSALPVKALGLNSTAISDHSVPVLLQMTNLEQLWIADTAISFKGVMQLSQLKHLQRLIVHRDQFSSRQIASLHESFGERLQVVDWERPTR